MSPAVDAALDAFAQLRPPVTARAWLTTYAPGYVDELLHELVRRYVVLGKFQSADTVLADLVAHMTDLDRLCGDLEQLVSARTHAESPARLLPDAEALVTAVTRSASPQCRRDADADLGRLAWGWQRERPWREADLAVADTLWRLDLAVVTTPERRAAALRDRAVIRWQIAFEARIQDPHARAWTAAAEAFAIAAATSPGDRELSAASAEAHVNATMIRSRRR